MRIPWFNKVYYYYYSPSTLDELGSCQGWWSGEVIIRTEGGIRSLGLFIKIKQLPNYVHQYRT